MPIDDVSAHSIEELVSLKGRVAVITAAGRGIGAATARRLGEAGAHVVVTDYDAEAAETVARQIRDAGGSATAAALDVTDDDAITELFRALALEHGTVDILVNNAGIYPDRRILDTTPEEWDLVQRMNLRSVFVCSKQVATRMVEAGRGGVIVNIAALAGLGIVPGMAAHYAVSKAGVVLLTQALALELGEHGIRAVAIAPGLVLTPGITEHPEFKKLESIMSPSLPLGRPSYPDDIARVVLFAAGDLGKNITGETITVDSGQALS